MPKPKKFKLKPRIMGVVFSGTEENARLLAEIRARALAERDRLRALHGT